MTSIKINGVEKAMSAGAWCNQEFGTAGWDLNFDQILHGRAQYEFVFRDTKYATLFALRWV
jgi:hypothetical protein